MTTAFESPPESLTASVTPEQQAQGIIQGALERETQKGEIAPGELAGAIEEEGKLAPLEVQHLLAIYIEALRRSRRISAVCALAPGIGGHYSAGRIEMALATAAPEGHGSIHETAAGIRSMYKHEVYHMLHRHDQPLTPVSTTEEEGVLVTIGETTFRDDTELVEAVTVTETGGFEDVSTTYQGYVERFGTAVAKSPHSKEEIVEAVNEDTLASVADAGSAPAEASGSGEGAAP